ncbi:hypothetical protein GCM10028801_30410 [Nocardioides maradonensis]
MGQQAIPNYEGHPVNGTAIKMSGSIPMDDLEGAIIGIDDVVQLVAQFRCVAVSHQADKDGNLVRVQVLRPMVMVPHAFDEEQPDEFIMRALPRPVQGSVIHSIEQGGDE